MPEPKKAKAKQSWKNIFRGSLSRKHLSALPLFFFLFGFCWALHSPTRILARTYEHFGVGAAAEENENSEFGTWNVRASCKRCLLLVFRIKMYFLSFSFPLDYVCRGSLSLSFSTFWHRREFLLRWDHREHPRTLHYGERVLLYNAAEAGNKKTNTQRVTHSSSIILNISHRQREGRKERRKESLSAFNVVYVSI